MLGNSFEQGGGEEKELWQQFTPPSASLVTVSCLRRERWDTALLNHATTFQSFALLICQFVSGRLK